MWEAIGNIPKAYYEGQDQAYKQKMQDAFSDSNGGLPLDAQGNFDAGKAWERLVKLGGAPGVDAAAKLAETGFQQDRYRNAPTVEGVLRGDLPQPPTTNFPPSANRNAPVKVAPALARIESCRKKDSRSPRRAVAIGRDPSWAF